MIPYTYNMVDMGGVDLTEVRGSVFSGLYSRIEDALDDTMVLVLYNWFCAGIKIAPSYVNITQESNRVIINEVVIINSDDTISIPGMSVLPVIRSLTIAENGTYAAPSGIDGYSPVSVNVPQPQPVIESLSVTENGTYSAPSGTDGYSPVSVNVPQPQPVIESLSVTENGTYSAPSGTDGYSPVSVNVPSGSDLSKLALKTGGNVIFSQGQVNGFTSSASIVKLLNPDNNSDSFLNFSSPFELNIRFKVSAFLSRSQVLCGNTANFYRQPSIEVGPSGNLWCGISSDGSTWTYSLALDNSVPTNTWCEANLKYDGSSATLKLTIGETVLSTDVSVSSVYNATSSYGLGGIANSSSHYATNVTIDLARTYIKINNSLVWGVE